MLDIRNLLYKFKEILRIETERNEMIANSTYGDFSVSSDTVFEFAVDRLLTLTNDAVIEDLNSTSWGR